MLFRERDAPNINNTRQPGGKFQNYRGDPELTLEIGEALALTPVPPGERENHPPLPNDAEALGRSMRFSAMK